MEEVTSIKATLSNIPIYYLSLFKIPKGVAAEIERLQNQFLWCGQEAKKPHLIDWLTVSRQEKYRGLALGGIINRNELQLGKMVVVVSFGTT